MEARDYFAVQNLINSYAEFLDRADFESLAGLFTEADVHKPEEVHRKNAAGLKAMWEKWCRVYPATGGLNTRHLISNVSIEEDGPDRARARSVITVLQATPDFPLQPIIVVTNNDRFQKIDGRWRFTERREATNLVGDLSAHLLITMAS